jgi:hypothetical protein
MQPSMPAAMEGFPAAAGVPQTAPTDQSTADFLKHLNILVRTPFIFSSVDLHPR